MRIFSARSRVFRLLISAGIFGAVSATQGFNPDARDKDKTDKVEKPSIAVKSVPAMGFAPFRVVLTADVKGGPDDYEEYYCATVEWDMGDGNKAEQQNDCDPYEAGKSQIKRRFVREQVFDTPGEFRVIFRLKQKNKVVGAGQTTIRVRPGIRDGMIDR
jgi:hypothetical protein